MTSALERMSFTDRIDLLDRLVLSIREIAEGCPDGVDLGDFATMLRDRNGLDDATTRHAMYYARAKGVIAFGEVSLGL